MPTTIENNNTNTPNTKCIVFIGPTGTGKTSVILYLSGGTENQDPELANIGGEIVTKIVELYQSDIYENQNPYIFNMIDTISLGSDISSAAIYEQIFNKMKIYGMAVDHIVIVAKIERYRNKVRDDMKDMIRKFRESGARDENFSLLITHIDPWVNDLRRNFIENYVEYHELTFIEPSHIFTGCFSSLSIVHPQLRSFYDRWVNLSVKGIREWLRDLNSIPFVPQRRSRLKKTHFTKSYSMKRRMLEQ
eukprot:TRINITY_DN7517_c0_g1_i1.p1 TRINITY_DN7517_c0_g1~~TRINITY_DN7517_c0_g1_i1.p1  ORF type:complete len:256 (+),score=43.30 TRINITY_DN7517_c0_g1_i1:27-770(+)